MYDALIDALDALIARHWLVRAWLLMHYQYAKYVWNHKRFVFRAGRPLGVSLWRLIVHDWSKLPGFGEWSAYAAYFYGGTKTAEVRAAFNRAWLGHLRRQDHHWQYWLLQQDDGIVLALPMPDQCRRELLADWRGAGLAQGSPDTAAWYRPRAAHIHLHHETRDWIEAQLFEGLTLAQFDRREAERERLAALEAARLQRLHGQIATLLGPEMADRIAGA